MAAINFAGIASGLDTDLLIESLLVTRQRRADAISQRISDEEEDKRALNDINSALERFQSSANSFTDEVFNNRTVTSSDGDVISATADGTSELGEYIIEVNQLATRSVVTVGAAQSSTSAQIGGAGGTLTLNNEQGDIFEVTVGANATLADLNEEINAQFGASLQSSIIEVSTGSFQLVVSTKDTGASLNIKSDAAASDPSSFTGFDAAFAAGGINQDADQAAVDAQFTLNGIDITRATNEVDDVLTGVTLDLQNAEPGKLIKLDVDTDLDEIVNQFDEFSKSYNDVISQINRVTNAETGTLSNDSDLNSLKSDLQAFATRFIANIDQINTRDDGSTGFTSLAQVGFKTDTLTGEFTVDTEVLREALEDNFTEVQALLSGGFTSSNANVTAIQSSSSSFSGELILDTINDTATIDGEVISLNRNGDILAFGSDSEYFGLSFLSTITNDSAVSLQISSGLGRTLDNRLDAFTGIGGVVFDRNQSIDDRTRSLERDLERANFRIDSERTRLTAVFAQAEQAISSLQGLQASLSAQLVGS